MMLLRFWIAATSSEGKAKKVQRRMLHRPREKKVVVAEAYEK
jgi:hypothetical protein